MASVASNHRNSASLRQSHVDFFLGISCRFAAHRVACWLFFSVTCRDAFHCRNGGRVSLRLFGVAVHNGNSIMMGESQSRAPRPRCVIWREADPERRPRSAFFSFRPVLMTATRPRPSQMFAAAAGEPGVGQRLCNAGRREPWSIQVA